MFITAFLGLFFNIIMLRILNSVEGDVRRVEGNLNDQKLSYEMEDLGLEGIEFNGHQKQENESLVLKLHDSLDQSDTHGSAISKSFMMRGEESNEDVYSDKYNKKRESDNEEHPTAIAKLKALFMKNSLKSTIKYNFSDNLLVRAAVIQIFSDILQSLKNLIVALSIYNLPDFLYIEPI
mmetsp:Transcript_12678/g.11235  ORF Transcript_12678/g.11235 Transcript_12678/m.11235 type:complete len:179 (+) Transcript_12678:370-906(+)